MGARDELTMARVIRVKVGLMMNRSFDAGQALQASSGTEGVLVVVNATLVPQGRTRVFEPKPRLIKVVGSKA
jgi:hypothetical protein